MNLLLNLVNEKKRHLKQVVTFVPVTVCKGRLDCGLPGILGKRVRNETGGFTWNSYIVPHNFIGGEEIGWLCFW